MVPFLFPRSLVCTAPATQGHIGAAECIGCIYFYGQGVGVDYMRALAAYKIGAEGGNAACQHQLGTMLSMEGFGCDVDYDQALVWYEKAAAQDFPPAFAALGDMCERGQGCSASFRRARAHFQRAMGLDLKSRLEGT